MIEIEKCIEFGQLPPHIGLGHRHFEKEMPASGYNATLMGEKVKETGKYIMPVDLAAKILPLEYIDQIDSIEIEYERIL